VEAVSQASSPKSNPNLSSSVRTFGVKGTTNAVDRSVTGAERRKVT
jgi:hypothetical protein